MGKNVLAFDFGASSGRAMLGKFDGTKIELTEIHRFDNDPVYINGTLYWDVLRLLHEIKQGLLKAENTSTFESIGIDTWGVDFGLISNENSLLENPIHYRDKRTSGMIDEVCGVISYDELYNKTGNQIMELNTLFQLYSVSKNRSHILSQSDKFLLTPDLFNYLLTGKKYAESTVASTSQLLNPFTKEWDFELIDKLSLPRSIFPQIIKAGTVVGQISDEICNELNIKSKTVISVASHDTASAVVSVPAINDDFIFISCGTWSLFGTELKSPIISEQSKEFNLANEGGYNDTTTFLKNIIGLWLIQETRRQFKREGKSYSYADMENLAMECTSFACFIDPDAPQFVPSGDIPTRIKEFCKSTGQYVPKTDGEVIRCIYESISMKYKYSFNQIKACTHKEYENIYMVGGGTKDNLLCQLTANATNCNVIAGPIEATAFGNVAVQLIALGEISDIKQAREIIKNSFIPVTYRPEQNQANKVWEDNYKQFKELLK